MKILTIAAGFVVALVCCSSSAHAQNDNGQGPDGVRARVFHFNDSGIVITEQLRVASKFTVEIDGVMVGGIHSIDGLEHEHEAVEYKDGEDRTIHTRPGNHKPGKITITKDWSSTSEFYKWMSRVLAGKVERKSMSIVFMNDVGEESRMNFFECWPVKWMGPSLNAKNSGHASELIEIAFERLEMK